MGAFDRRNTCVLFMFAAGISSCDLYPRARPPQRALAPYGAPYVDQRAMSGAFFPPARAAPPAHPVPRRPTLLSTILAGSTSQALWSLPTGNAPLPWLPWLSTPTATSSWSGLALAPIQPPPHALRSPPRAGCGYVQVGAYQIPIDCSTPGYGEIPSAARPVVPQALFRLSSAHAGAAELPTLVDHRDDHTEGPIRHQGEVGACSGFSFATAVDHALAARTGQPGHVSAMHVWSRYHQPSMTLPFERNKDRPLTTEEMWPYTKDNQTAACSWVARNQCRPSCGKNDSCACTVLEEQQCAQPVDADTLARADAAPVARVTDTTRLETDKSTLMEAIAKGQDVWMAMRFTYDAFDSDKLLRQHDGLPFVLPDFDPEDATSAHAMVLAGYRVQSKGTYFLLHNSWGTDWGDGGYVWVHETTLKKNLLSAYIVEAEPWDARNSKVPPRQSAPSQCGDSLLPDSITGQCVPPCADGSARHNAVCADARDCPAGYVNLYGDCVVEAPTTHGTDAASSVTYACAAGGCSYVIPFGKYGCFLPWCSASCPSPRFRLAQSVFGYSCVE